MYRSRRCEVVAVLIRLCNSNVSSQSCFVLVNPHDLLCGGFTLLSQDSTALSTLAVEFGECRDSIFDNSFFRNILSVAIS